MSPEIIETEDAREIADRTRTVISILERCEQELLRLETIPAVDASRCNALSAARGFVARARGILGRSFG